MRVRARREILVGLQFLLIGIIAEIIAEFVIGRWFRGERPDLVRRLIVWSLSAISLGVLRIGILVLATVLRRDQWQTISRRNWI